MSLRTVIEWRDANKESVPEEFWSLEEWEGLLPVRVEVADCPTCPKDRQFRFDGKNWIMDSDESRPIIVDGRVTITHFALPSDITTKEVP